MKGSHISDEEVNQLYIYFLMGYFFHYRPDEVDQMDSITVEGMLAYLVEFKKLENDVK